MRSFLRGIILAAAAALSAHVQPAAAADASLIDAAKKEGSVTWYTTYIVDQSVRPMIVGFEKAYPGIKVEFVRQASADLVLRLSNEAKAGRIQADLFDGNSTYLPLRKADLIAAWRPDSARVFPPQFADPNGYWSATTVSYFGAMINTQILAPADAPDPEDLLAPKLAGHMAWSINPDLSAAVGFIGNILMTMGRDRGMAYLEKLSKQNIAGLQTSSRQVVDQVIGGEYTLGLQMLAQQQTALVAEGAPIAWVPLSPVMSALNVVGLVKGGPHPNAGKLLVDYILSAEGQSIFAGPGYIVPRPGVKLMNPAFTPEGGHFEANVLPPDFDTTQIAEWQSVFGKLFR